MAIMVGQGVRQDLPGPGGALGFVLSPELSAFLVGLQQGLLNNIRGIQLALEARGELQPGEEPQIVPVFLQGPPAVLGFHGYSLTWPNHNHQVSASLLVKFFSKTSRPLPPNSRVGIETGSLIPSA